MLLPKATNRKLKLVGCNDQHHRHRIWIYWLKCNIWKKKNIICDGDDDSTQRKMLECEFIEKGLFQNILAFKKEKITYIR